MSNARYVEGGDLEPLIDPPRNTDVLRYLSEHQPSCHSDLGDLLLRVTWEGCGGAVAYSPSFRQCRYVALVAERIVFGLGIDQRSVCYRLPADLRLVALQAGAVPAPEIGDKWVRFELFRPGWPQPDLAFWTLKAYTGCAVA